MRASRSTRLRRAVAVACSTLVALVAGCGTASKVPDDAEVTIAGRLTQPDGTPAAGVSVVLFKEPDVAEAFGGVMATVASLGLLCLARAVDVCKGARKTKTDDTGTYTFRLTGRDTHGTFKTASTMALSAELPRDAGAGPVVHARFKVQRTALIVPTLAFWEPADLVVRPDASKVRFSWSDHPGLNGRKPREYTVTATSGNGVEDVVWTADEVRSGESFDARAIGDLRGSLHVTATVKAKDDDTEFTTLYGSQHVRLVGAAGRPPSRDANCAVAGRHGEPAPLTPCSLTDGAYARTYRHQPCRDTDHARVPPSSRGQAPGSAEACRSNTWLQVDLGVRRPATAVFAHGLSVSSQVVVETSDDGITWRHRAQTRQSRFLMVALPPGTSARYVRVSQEDGSAISQLNELAVWP